MTSSPTGRLVTMEPELRSTSAPRGVLARIIGRWWENPITQSLTPVSERWLVNHNYDEGKGGFQL